MQNAFADGYTHYTTGQWHGTKLQNRPVNSKSRHPSPYSPLWEPRSEGQKALADPAGPTPCPFNCNSSGVAVEHVERYPLSRPAEHGLLRLLERPMPQRKGGRVTGVMGAVIGLLGRRKGAEAAEGVEGMALGWDVWDVWDVWTSSLWKFSSASGASPWHSLIFSAYSPSNWVAQLEAVQVWRSWWVEKLGGLWILKTEMSNIGFIQCPEKIRENDRTCCSRLFHSNECCTCVLTSINFLLRSCIAPIPFLFSVFPNNRLAKYHASLACIALRNFVPRSVPMVQAAVSVVMDTVELEDNAAVGSYSTATRWDGLRCLVSRVSWKRFCQNGQNGNLVRMPQTLLSLQSLCTKALMSKCHSRSFNSLAFLV